MYCEEALEEMTTEEITERIDKEICSIADTFKDESEWKENMMKLHRKSLQEDLWVYKRMRCAPMTLELTILGNRIDELSQLISEEIRRTSKGRW